MAVPVAPPPGDEEGLSHEEFTRLAETRLAQNTSNYIEIARTTVSS